MTENSNYNILGRKKPGRKKLQPKKITNNRYNPISKTKANLGTLPEKYKKVWLDVYDATYKKYGDKSRAARTAWSVVKKKCSKTQPKVGTKNKPKYELDSKWVCNPTELLKTEFESPKEFDPEKYLQKARGLEDSLSQYNNPKTRVEIRFDIVVNLSMAMQIFLQRNEMDRVKRINKQINYIVAEQINELR